MRLTYAQKKGEEIMKKRKYDYGRNISDEAKKKQHRGEGTGAAYIPWIKVQDFNDNQGLASITIDPYTKRGVHLLSAGEIMAWYILRYDTNVVDIREQFPLNIDITKRICQENGLSHPSRNSRTGFHEIVMTSDFLVDFKNGSEKVYSVKYDSSYLLNENTKKNLFIEKTYWNNKDIEFIIITREQLEPMSYYVANLRQAFYIADIDQIHDIYSFIQYSITHHLIDIDLTKRILDLDEVIENYPMLKNEYLRFKKGDD